MRRYAQIALLFLLGGMLLKLAFSGAYLRYVAGAHLPLLIIGGLALVAIAGANLWREIQAARNPDEEPTSTGLRLGGLFRTDWLSAPDRPARQPAAPPEVPAGSGGRAVAAGLAAAAHEGLDATAELPALSADAAPAAGGGWNDRTVAVGELVEEPVPAVDAPRAPVGGAGTRGGWALLVLALAVLLVAPPALGPWPASRSGTLTVAGPVPTPAGSVVPTPTATAAVTTTVTATATPEPTTSSSDVPGTAEPVSMSLVDYAARAAAGGESLAGVQVRLVGFIVAGPQGEPYLARLVIGCCAAGARPVKVGLTGDLPGVLTADRWLAVVGDYVARTDTDPVNGAPIPYLSVVSVTDVPPPADPYES